MHRDLVQSIQLGSGNSKHPSFSAVIVHVGMEAKEPAAAGPMDIRVMAEEAILDKRETCLSWDLAGKSHHAGVRH